MISCTFKEPPMLQLLSQQLPNKVNNVGHTVQHVPSLWKVYKAQYLQECIAVKPGHKACNLEFQSAVACVTNAVLCSSRGAFPQKLAHYTRLRLISTLCTFINLD